MSFTTCDDQKGWICEAVLPSVPGLGAAQVERVYFRVLDEFLRLSGSWIEEALFTADQFGQVGLNTKFKELKAQVVHVMAVMHGHRVIPHTASILPTYRSRIASYPQYWTNTPYPDVIKLWPKPGTENDVEVVVRASLALNDCEEGACAIPDWVFSHFRHVLRAGVIATLLDEPDKPYTNFQQARRHRSAFSTGSTRARDESRRGWGLNEAEWVFPRTFEI